MSVGKNGASVAAFIEALNTTKGGLKHLCDRLSSVEAKKVCTNVSDTFAVGKPAWQLVRTISQQRYREAAVSVIRDLIPLASTCKEDEKSGVLLIVDIPVDTAPCNTRKRVRAFSESVVAYIADISEKDDVAMSTRAAFKHAAVDLIRTIGLVGGIDREYWNRVRTPQLSLSYSWSTGFVNESSPSNARLTASLDWINARVLYRRSTFAFYDLRLWVLDGLGPFSEIAMRKDGDYVRPVAPWLLFIKPKVTFMFASPALSTHLALNAYVSWRPVAAYETPAGQLKYTFIWSNQKDLSDDWSHFIEFGLAIAYVL